MGKIENNGFPTDLSISGLAKPIVTELAPYGIKFVKVLLFGKNIMICGPQNAGKTHFKLYFLNGLFLPEVSENERESTFDFEVDKNKLINYGKNNNQNFWLKKFIDSPGELPPKYQVQKLEKYKPKCLIIYLNCEDYAKNGADCNSVMWLRHFYVYLRNSLSQNIRLNKSLQLIEVVLNKYDKIDEAKYKQFKDLVDKMNVEYLEQCFIKFQFKDRAIPVLPCISVDTDKGDKYLVAIINNIISRIK